MLDLLNASQDCPKWRALAGPLPLPPQPLLTVRQEMDDDMIMMMMGKRG